MQYLSPVYSNYLLLYAVISGFIRTFEQTPQTPQTRRLDFRVYTGIILLLQTLVAVADPNFPRFDFSDIRSQQGRKSSFNNP